MKFNTENSKTTFAQTPKKCSSFLSCDIPEISSQQHPEEEPFVLYCILFSQDLVLCFCCCCLTLSAYRQSNSMCKGPLRLLWKQLHLPRLTEMPARVRENEKWGKRSTPFEIYTNLKMSPPPSEQRAPWRWERGTIFNTDRSLLALRKSLMKSAVENSYSLVGWVHSRSTRCCIYTINVWLSSVRKFPSDGLDQ